MKNTSRCSFQATGCHSRTQGRHARPPPSVHFCWTSASSHSSGLIGSFERSTGQSRPSYRMTSPPEPGSTSCAEPVGPARFVTVTVACGAAAAAKQTSRSSDFTSHRYHNASRIAPRNRIGYDMCGSRPHGSPGGKPRSRLPLPAGHIDPRSAQSPDARRCHRDHVNNVVFARHLVMRSYPNGVRTRGSRPSRRCACSPTRSSRQS